MGLVREAVRTCMHDAQSEHCPLLEEGCVVCRRACTAGTRIETTRSTAVDNETHTASPRRPGDSTESVCNELLFLKPLCRQHLRAFDVSRVVSSI